MREPTRKKVIAVLEQATEPMTNIELYEAVKKAYPKKQSKMEQGRVDEHLRHLRSANCLVKKRKHGCTAFQIKPRNVWADGTGKRQRRNNLLRDLK